jgi:pyruvate/2-oxoglutarate dehydrogenase complex dihydrolipoamide acyltransferase (E2) component
VTEKQSEALEKLNRGIQESRQEVQQRTMNLAQDYFGDSADVLKQQISENRAALEGLPDQIPGGREEAFQGMFQELMNNYSAMEECIDQARENVANLDTEKIRRQGEVDATDAARREARELGLDLTEIEGTGTDGRIIVSDVVEASKDAARRRAEELGVDLSQIEGSGSGGLVSVKDVEAAADGAGDQAGEIEQDARDAVEGAQDMPDQATDRAGQVAGQATDQVGQVASQAQDAAGGAAQQAQGTVGQVTDQAGQVAGQAQDTAGQAAQQGQQAAGGGEEEGPRATNAARRKAEAMGVDLSQVQGTGSGGLITIKDVTGS